MTDRTLSLTEILQQAPADARRWLGLDHMSGQDQAMAALTLAQTAASTLFRMDQIKRLYALKPIAEAVADDFEQNASHIVKRQKSIGEAETPRDELDAFLMRENDRAMMRWSVMDVRTEGVAAFFKDNVPVAQPFTAMPTIDPVMEQAQAVAELAQQYEDSEKIAVQQEIAREYMKVPDWYPVGLSYVQVFEHRASQAYDRAAQQMVDAGQIEIAQELTDAAHAIRLDHGQVTTMTMTDFANDYIQKYHEVTDMTNMMLDPQGFRDVPYIGENVQFLQRIAYLGRVADGRAPYALLSAPRLKPVP